MRISKAQIENLKNSILSIQPDSKVFLFGSRIDDNNKGGDIDILILGKRKLNLLENCEIKKTFVEKFG